MGSAGRGQCGFVRSSVLDLTFLLILLLLAIGLWQWLSTILSSDFMLAWFMVSLMAAGAAGWWTRSQTLVLGPLSWWSGSKLAVVAEAAVLAVGAKYLGALWSERLKLKLAAAPAPWYLDQSINLVADLIRWLLVCIVTWFAAGVLPLMLVLVFVLPVEWVPWVALLWAFTATAFYLFKYRHSRVRFFKIPLGLWAFMLAAAILRLFQQRLVGSMEAGSIELIAYAAYWPAVIAMFVEFVVIGTRKATASLAPITSF